MTRMKMKRKMNILKKKSKGNGTQRETNNLHSFQFLVLILMRRFGRNTQIKQVNYYENIFSRKLNNILNRFAFSSESFLEHSQNVYIVCIHGWVEMAVTETKDKTRENFIIQIVTITKVGTRHVYIWFVLLQCILFSIRFENAHVYAHARHIKSAASDILE